MDLLEYMPDSLRVDDVKGAVSDKLIVQMVAQQASVAQLVGASLKVTSLERYLAVMKRVFEALGVPASPTEWLTGSSPNSTACWMQAQDLAALQAIFEFRHSLVHEIGMEIAGHWNIRDNWDADMAKTAGRLVLNFISGLEYALTTYAPALFPNLLSEERHPASPSTRFKAEMERLELSMSETKGSWGWEVDETTSLFEDANFKFAQYMEAELEFIEQVRPPYFRYIDVTTPLKTRLYKFRIDFLRELATHNMEIQPDGYLSEVAADGEG
jgi:hypothetical protein